MEPTNEQLWEALGLRDVFIDDLRYALTLALEEIDQLTEIANVALPRDYQSWKDLVRPGAKPTSLPRS